MVDYITLEEILRDKEVLQFLKKRYEDRVPQLQLEEVSVAAADDPIETTATEPELTQEASQPLSPEEPAPATPSPTYSFPSISEEDTDSPTECDPVDSPKEEQQETQQEVGKEENKEEQQGEQHTETKGEQLEENAEQIVTEPAVNKDNVTSEVTVSAEKTDVKSSTTAVSTHSLLEDETNKLNAEKTTPPKDDRSPSPCSPELMRRKPKIWEIKPPPIFITHQRQWKDVVVWCSERKIKLKYVSRTPFGMKVTAFSWKDFQNFTILLIEKRIKFKKKSETRVFQAAVRYVPKQITTEEIRTALLDEKIPVEQVTRLPCQLKHLRSTHDMVVVKVVWCNSGRRLYRYNPLHDLFDKRRHLFNQEGISPFEKYPFIKHSGLSNYKPPELFGITTGGYMESTKPPRYFEEESYYLDDLPVGKPFYEQICCTGGQTTSNINPANTALADQTAFPTTATGSSSAQAESSHPSTNASSVDKEKALEGKNDDKDMCDMKEIMYKSRNDPISLVFLGMKYSHLINKLSVLDK